VQKHVPLEMDQKLLQNLFLEGEETGKCPTDSKVDYMDGSEILGSGLKNDIGKNYSSLNVIIQVQLPYLSGFSLCSFLNIDCFLFLYKCLPVLKSASPLLFLVKCSPYGIYHSFGMS